MSEGAIIVQNTGKRRKEIVAKITEVFEKGVMTVCEGRLGFVSCQESHQLAGIPCVETTCTGSLAGGGVEGTDRGLRPRPKSFTLRPMKRSSMLAARMTSLAVGWGVV